MRSGAFVLALVCAHAGAASAQDAEARSRLVSGEEFVMAFNGHCSMNPGRRDKIETAARVFEYVTLDADSALMLGPIDPGADFQGWLANEGPASPYMLGVTEGAIEGTPFVMCTMMNPFIRTQDVIQALEASAVLGERIHDQTLAGQRERVWETPLLAPKSFITLYHLASEEYGGATLSFSAPKLN